MPKYLNLSVFIGKVYGQLTVLTIERRSTRLFVTAKCTCGIIKTYVHSKLVVGHTQSCGCMRINLLRKRMTIHGETKTRLYNIWNGMNDRCRRKNNRVYKNYGGRGISVCSEWKANYEVFKKWALENGYDGKLTIDRINTNGNYEPINCRWADATTQMRNTRNNHIIEYNGKIKTMAEWSENLCMKYNTLSTRINTFGWSIEKSLNTPVKK